MSLISRNLSSIFKTMFDVAWSLERHALGLSTVDLSPRKIDAEFVPGWPGSPNPGTKVRHAYGTAGEIVDNDGVLCVRWEHGAFEPIDRARWEKSIADGDVVVETETRLRTEPDGQEILVAAAHLPRPVVLETFADAVQAQKKGARRPRLHFHSKGHVTKEHSIPHGLSAADLAARLAATEVERDAFQRDLEAQRNGDAATLVEARRQLKARVEELASYEVSYRQMRDERDKIRRANGDLLKKFEVFKQDRMREQHAELSLALNVANRERDLAAAQVDGLKNDRDEARRVLTQERAWRADIPVSMSEATLSELFEQIRQLRLALDRIRGLTGVGVVSAPELYGRLLQIATEALALDREKFVAIFEEQAKKWIALEESLRVANAAIDEIRERPPVAWAVMWEPFLGPHSVHDRKSAADAARASIFHNRTEIWPLIRKPEKEPTR